MSRSLHRFLRRLREDDGTTLVETTIACGILFVAMAGLMSMGTIATMHTENQGHLAPRTTEYAQDKMEQLLALAYGDTTSDTRSFPAVTLANTGLKVGGSYNVDSPVALYVDYLDIDGNLCGSTGAACTAPVGTVAPTGWFYKRVWKIDDQASDGTLPANLKQITVGAATSRGFGGSTRATAYLTVLKTNPF